MSDSQQPLSGVEQTQVAQPPFWMKLLTPVLLLLGWFVGVEIGESVGAGYEGVGRASGERIGKWLGWGIGVGTAFLLGAILIPQRSLPPIAGSSIRRGVSIALIWMAFVLSGVMGAVGEMYFGELGGPGLFVLTWFVMFLVVMLIARKDREAREA